MPKVYLPRPRVPGPTSLQERLFRWRKLFWLGVGIIVFVVGDAALLVFGPPAFFTSAIATGASFSVSAGSFATQDRAAAFAAALDASELPILVRARPDDGRYQVLVGPYVSTEEAEHAQRALAAWGLGEPRLVVDDTMRSRPQNASIFGGDDAGGDGVLIVAAAGMSSVVFEMSKAPRNVEARRTSATTLDVEIGDTAGAGAGDLLTLPDGVPLVREMRVAAAATRGAMRAHLVVPEGVQSRLRLEGRRVYVDLAWPKAPWQVGSRTARATQKARAPVPPPKAPSRDGVDASQTRANVTAIDAYHEQLRGAVERFEEIRPFLISVVESPDPEVLAALAHTVEGIADVLASLSAPPDRVFKHQVLSAAARLAASAVAPSFDGDRSATVRQAIAMFDDATK